MRHLRSIYSQVNIIKESTDKEYYSYDSLSVSSKSNAIEGVRNAMYNGKYGGDDIPRWVIDDDYILEPSHKEMESLFGVNYNKDLLGRPMISNTRKNFHFASKDDRNYYLHCADSIDITNENMFLDWLGIPFYFHDAIASPYFRDITSYTKIYLDPYTDQEGWSSRDKEQFDKYLDDAEEKWESHLSWVLDNITKSINYELENDDAIIDRIENNDIKFNLEGNPID